MAYIRPMKNRAESNWSHMEIARNQLVGLSGFYGYFVDRFNDVYSARRKSKPLAPWKNAFPSGAVVERLNLFDDEGKRRQLSRRKILIETLGLAEFERREGMRENRVEIVATEKAAQLAWAKLEEIEDQRILDEIHADDETTTEEQFQNLEPFIKELIIKNRKRKAAKAAETLGELF